MIPKVFAQSFENIYFYKIPSSKCPCEFILIFRIKIWIKESSKKYDWKGYKECRVQKWKECTISENFDKKQWNPTNWRCISHHKLDWNQSSKYHCLFWKSWSNLLIEIESYNCQYFFNSISKTSNQKCILNPISQIENKSNLSCTFSNSIFTYFPQVSISNYNKAAMNNVWTNSNCPICI